MTLVQRCFKQMGNKRKVLLAMIQSIELFIDLKSAKTYLYSVTDIRQNYIGESFLVFIELCGNSPAYFTHLNKQRGIHYYNILLPIFYILLLKLKLIHFDKD